MAYRVTIMKLNYPTKNGKDRIVRPGELVPDDVKDPWLLHYQESSGQIALVPDELKPAKRSNRSASSRPGDPSAAATESAEAQS